MTVVIVTLVTVAVVTIVIVTYFSKNNLTPMRCSWAAFCNSRYVFVLPLRYPVNAIVIDNKYAK